MRVKQAYAWIRERDLVPRYSDRGIRTGPIKVPENHPRCQSKYTNCGSPEWNPSFPTAHEIPGQNDETVVPIKQVTRKFLSKTYRELTNLAGRMDNAISKYTTNFPCHTNDINIFLNTVREMRYNKFISDWKKNLQENRKWSKLDTYKMIEHDYRVEPHLLYVRNKRYQRAITRLRVSSHKLNIEAGRHIWPYIPRQQRVCLHHTTGELDDEFDFLLICHFHSEGRYSMLQEFGNYLPLQPRIDKTCLLALWRQKISPSETCLGNLYILI